MRPRIDLRFEALWPSILSGALLLFSAQHLAAQQSPQEVHDAARAYGTQQAQSEGAKVRNGQSEQALRTTVQGYTANPPEKQLYNSQGASTATSTMQAQCQADPTNPICAGVRIGTTQRPASTITPSNPALASQDAVRNPTLVLGDIAQTYNACSVGGAQTAPAGYTQQACDMPASPWSTQTCSKRLSVKNHTTHSCADNTAVQSVLSNDITARVMCKPLINPLIRLELISGTTNPDCRADPLALTLNMNSPMPRWGDLPPLLATLPGMVALQCKRLEVRWDGQGCSGAYCGFKLHLSDRPPIRKYSCPAGTRLGSTIPFNTPPAGAATSCFYPRPVLPPPPPPPPGGYAGAVYWAYFSPATYIGYEWADAPATHEEITFNFTRPVIAPATGDTWASSCAALEAKTPLLQADGIAWQGEVQLPLLSDDQQCVRTASVCTDGPSTKVIDGEQVSRACWSYANTFQCSSSSGFSAACAPASNNQCVPRNGAACTARDPQGRCLNSLQQFDCKTSDATFTPAVNCGNASFCAGGSCWQSTSPANTQFLNATAQLNAHVAAAKDKTFDGENVQTIRIFKGQDRRCHINLFGIDNCCDDDNYITQCSAEDQETYQKRVAGRCHEVGSYCSRSVLGFCRERTKTHCCFTSLLARLVQEQGRQQLNWGWGAPKTPDCEGFTTQQLTALDWSRFDLSEFYAQINPQPMPQGTATDNVQASRPSCYWGQGRC